MEKCPKCGEVTLKEVPSIGSKLLGKSKKCISDSCSYSIVPQNTTGTSLASLMNKKKKDEEE